jgi:hypothetical protein
MAVTPCGNSILDSANDLNPSISSDFKYIDVPSVEQADWLSGKQLGPCNTGLSGNQKKIPQVVGGRSAPY